jgi:hypothetical protein
MGEQRASRVPRIERPRRRALSGLLLIVAGVAGQACSGDGDECVAGTLSCDGKVIRQCRQGADCGEGGGDCSLRWEYYDRCGDKGIPATPPFCVTSEQPDGAGAFCALSPNKDPSCEGKSGYCTADAAVVCQEGYAVDSIECESPKDCWGDGVCTDPRCMPFADGDGRLCDGLSLLECTHGNSASTACAVSCISLPGFSGLDAAFCALSSKPDARCDSSAGFCDGDIVVSCRQGFATSIRTCEGTCKC